MSGAIKNALGGFGEPTRSERRMFDPDSSAQAHHTIPSLIFNRQAELDSSAGRLPWEEINPRAGLTLPTAPAMPRAGKAIDSLFDTALEGSPEPNLTTRSSLRIKGFLSKGK